MDRGKILKDISAKHLALLKEVPAKLKHKLFLTGGTVAFLYGSERPFSNDLDYMIPKNMISDFEKASGARFWHHRAKPIFHSLKTVINTQGTSYDIIAESIVMPENDKREYAFYLTDQIIKRSFSFRIPDSGILIKCIPAELIVLLKLLAGRGKKSGKYDLYDICSIIENEELNMDFFGDLISQFCEGALPFLIKNAKKAKSEYSCSKMGKIISFLELFRP